MASDSMHYCTEGTFWELGSEQAKTLMSRNIFIIALGPTYLGFHYLCFIFSWVEDISKQLIYLAEN